MKNILDFEEDTGRQISFADRAFIYFKWAAVFFTASLLVNYYQENRMFAWHIASAVIFILLILVVFLSMISIRFSLKSFMNEEPLGYKNLVSFLAGIAAILFGLYVLLNSW